MPTINFLRERRRKLTKQQLLDQQLFKVASIVSGVVVFLLVLIVIARVVMAILLNNTTTRQTALLQSIKQQESNERAYLIFAAKLQTLSTLLAKRQDKQQAITYFSTLFGQGVLISDITYEGDKAMLTFGLKSADVFILKNVVALLRSAEVRSQFKEVKTEALGRSPTGEYQTVVSVTLADTDLTKP